MPHLTRRLALLLLLAPRPAASEPAFTLAALMARLAAVPERRSVFREVRRFAALSEPLESRGRLLYRRPGHLEKVTDWPQPERLVIDGERLILTPATDPPRVVDLAAQPELRVLVDAMRGPLAGDLAALERGFAVRLEGGWEAWSLELVPREARALRVLRRVRIAGREAELTELALVQGNGDEQVMLIGPAN